MAQKPGELAPSAIAKIIADELHETPELRAQGITFLRLKLGQDLEHLNGTDLTDDQLGRFLRCRKYDMERVVETLSNFLRFRLEHQTIFRNLTASAVEAQLTLGLPQVLPTRARSGASILMMRMRKIDLDRFALPAIMHMMVVVLERITRDPQTQACGFVVIQDASEFPLRDLRKTAAAERRNMLHFIQECLPGRVKGLNIYHPPWFFWMAFALMKPFLSAKMQSRLKMNYTIEDLLEIADLDALPKDLGGKLEYTNEQFIEWLKSDALHPAETFFV